MTNVTWPISTIQSLNPFSSSQKPTIARAWLKKFLLVWVFPSKLALRISFKKKFFTLHKRIKEITSYKYSKFVCWWGTGEYPNMNIITLLQWSTGQSVCPAQLTVMMHNLELIIECTNNVSWAIEILEIQTSNISFPKFFSINFLIFLGF